jgi:hypothetical protein
MPKLISFESFSAGNLRAENGITIHMDQSLHRRDPEYDAVHYLFYDYGKTGQLVHGYMLRREGGDSPRWSDQIFENLRLAVLKTKNLNGFVFCDSVGAHRKLLGWKFFIRVAGRLLIGVPDPVHWISNFLRVLCKGGKVKVCGRIVDLWASYFIQSDACNKFRTGESSIWFLDDFFDKANLDAIFAGMEDGPDKEWSWKIIKQLQQIYEILSADREISASDIRIFRGSFQIFFYAFSNFFN